MLRVFSTYRLSALVLVALTATGRSPASSALRQDRAWKTYLNRTAGFCISYPSRWAKSETYDGSGLAVATGVKRHSPIPVGSMDVSALPFGGGEVRTASLTLDHDFDLQLAGLKKFVRAQEVEILERRAFTLAAMPSLFMKVRYLDPRDRRIWVDEVIFSRRNRLSYRLELEARADQLERFEANFTRFVNSFRMECGSPASTGAAAASLSAFRLTH